MNTAKEIIKDTEMKMRKSVDATKREFMEVRTGRAHTGLIEGLHVDYFGTNMRFRDLASITVPDPATIVIQPWDPTVIPDLERSISSSALGITPQNDGKIIRLVVPPLSQERREELKKIVKDMAEKGRISLRTVRRDSNEKIKKLAAEKKVSEDEDKRSHDEIQKMTDKFIKEIDDLLVEKTKQLSEH